LQEEFPLLYSVARATIGHPSQEPRVVRLEVTGEGPITDTLYLVGKGTLFGLSSHSRAGVCYDSGGLDIKVGGIMAGMSRDKCGAANVAGRYSL
jgi:leucyl aminopeptidase